MKKIVVVTAFIAVMFALASALYADAVVELGNDGKSIRASNSVVVWKQTDIVISDDVFAYGDAWARAYAKPGEIIPISTPHEQFARDGLFHTKSVIITDTSVFYDEGSKHIGLVFNVSGKPKRLFNPYLILWLSSLIVMAIAVEWRKEKNVFGIYSVVAGVISLVAAVVVVSFAYDAGICAGAACAASLFFGNKFSKIIVTFYYLSMVASVVCFLLS